MKAIIQSRLSLVLSLLILSLVILTPSGHAQLEPYQQTDLTISSILMPETVNQGEEFGSRTRVTIYNQGTTIIEGGYYLEMVVSSDRQAPIQSAQPTTTFIEDGLLPNGRITMPTMVPESTVTLTIPGMQMVSDAPLDKIIFICAVIDPEDVIDERWRGYHDGYGVNKLCMPIDVVGTGSSAPLPIQPPVDEPPAEGPPPGPQPEPPTRTITSNGTLGDYDTDGDCTLSDAEFFSIVDDWTSETASSTLFFSAIDAWMGQREICTAAQSSQHQLQIEMTSQGLLLRTSDLKPIKIEILNINGEVIFRQQTATGRLHWNLRDLNSQPVANGIYLVRNVNQGDVRKIVLMR